MTRRYSGEELLFSAALSQRNTKAARLERVAAQMRARNSGRISQREHARRQPRTPDGRRFA